MLNLNIQMDQIFVYYPNKQFLPQLNQIDLTGISDRRPKSLVLNPGVKQNLNEALDHHTKELISLKKQGRLDRNEWLKNNQDREPLDGFYDTESGRWANSIPLGITKIFAAN